MTKGDKGKATKKYAEDMKDQAQEKEDDEAEMDFGEEGNDKEEDINEGQGQSETDIEVDDQIQNQGNNTKCSKIRYKKMVKTKNRVVFMLSKRVVKKKRSKVTMKN